MLIRPLAEKDYQAVTSLANQVHGHGYFTIESLHEMHLQGVSHSISACFVLEMNLSVVGFRITFAPKQWFIDQWCSPELWGLEPESVCYFKSNTLHESVRGKGYGQQLLQRSIQAVKLQGGKAGIGHIWCQSPNNAAIRYFERAGAAHIKTHKNRWHDPKEYQGFNCQVCRGQCHCSAEEMLLRFK